MPQHFYLLIGMLIVAQFIFADVNMRGGKTGAVKSVFARSLQADKDNQFNVFLYPVRLRQTRCFSGRSLRQSYINSYLVRIYSGSSATGFAQQQNRRCGEDESGQDKYPGVIVGKHSGLL